MKEIKCPNCGKVFSVDVRNFEQQLLDFKDKFGRNYRIASEIHFF